MGTNVQNPEPTEPPEKGGPEEQEIDKGQEGRKGNGEDEAKQQKARASISTVLVELALAAVLEFFHTPDRDAYARILAGDHFEVHAVQGATFRRFLRRLFYDEYRAAVAREAMTAALATLETIAEFNTSERIVYRRVAPGLDGTIVLDLGDDSWRVVVVGRDGWKILDQPPVMFVRGNKMRALPEPVRGGKLTDLRAFLNVKSDDDWLLVVAWLAFAIRPTGPYPILHVHGEQGTAKTTFGKMLRGLIDPNAVELRSQPRDERDLAVSSKYGWVLGYDNLSSILPWFSDALCRVSTGSGFGTRTLFTNDEETVFEFTRPVLITSIEDVIGQPDLLDRCLAIELAPIPDSNRATEAELWMRFNAARPGILGGLLDAVAEALELLPTVVAENRPVPRMADFAVFGETVARALGEQPGRFLEVLRAARSGADQDAIEGSALAQTLLDWVRTQRQFRGTHTELLRNLNMIAAVEARRQPNWPKNPQHLSGCLRRMAPALRRLGVSFVNQRVGHERRRNLVIRYAPATPGERSSASSAVPVNSPEPHTLGADDRAAPTPSTDRSPPPTVPTADDGRSVAVAQRTTPSSASKNGSHKEVAPTADTADDVPHEVVGVEPHGDALP